MWKPTQFLLVYPEDTLQRGRTLPAISPVIPGENLFQKIKCGFFAARNVFRQKRVPKIPSRACGNFVPKTQLRFFPRTQRFPQKRVPKIPRSLWKFCSKKSTAAFSPHAKFSAKTECPRFHGEPVEIQTSQPHHVHVQWRGCICFLPLKSTLLCCHPEYLFFSSVEISAFHRYCVAEARHPH